MHDDQGLTELRCFSFFLTRYILCFSQISYVITLHQIPPPSSNSRLSLCAYIYGNVQFCINLLAIPDDLYAILTEISKLVQLWSNSPGPLMDDWKVMDNLSVNFHDVFFFIFCQIIAKNEEKYIMEIYG